MEVYSQASAELISDLNGPESKQNGKWKLTTIARNFCQSGFLILKNLPMFAKLVLIILKKWTSLAVDSLVRLLAKPESVADLNKTTYFMK